ncbi:cation diffusion facilitator family transporter [Roseiarcaceae bacterium H3SJ34-1]|uniref:cation diffusion facilitator family transporter n=1 Tax=Terripilifer ovatus TaxID=3032367 RepID=UPI003AB9AD72|nr:cation diffusion facilitator family transporter [Roseiarcaceae bacterium H3SJ34-1]
MTESHNHAPDEQHGHDHDHPHDQDHSHGHDHGHDHGPGGHSHAPASFGRAFAIGIALNTAFVLIEAGYGFFANSVALLSDAGHNLSDVLSLIVAWIAAILAARAPKGRYTYGLRSSSILAALFNAVFLLVAIGALSWEAIYRLIAGGEHVAGQTVIVVAAIGILINGVTAWLFSSGAKDDLNIRGAYLHMLSDAVVSVGVVVTGFVILYTGWNWLDPLASLAINAVIIIGTWSLLRDSLELSLNAAPRNIEPEAVRAYLGAQTGVANIHDLHIWAMSTTETALTVHLRMPGGHPGDAFLLHIAHDLKEKFRINHPTLQIETSADTVCALEPDHVV